MVGETVCIRYGALHLNISRFCVEGGEDGDEGEQQTLSLWKPLNPLRQLQVFKTKQGPWCVCMLFEKTRVLVCLQHCFLKRLKVTQSTLCILVCFPSVTNKYQQISNPSGEERMMAWMVRSKWRVQAPQQGPQSQRCFPERSEGIPACQHKRVAALAAPLYFGGKCFYVLLNVFQPLRMNLQRQC